MVPKIRFKRYKDSWKIAKVSSYFEVTRGKVLSTKKIKKKSDKINRYPVYSSQTLHKGLLGFYNKYLFQNAITWTTDGANAGTVLYRSGKFYSTNVNGVLLSSKGYANITTAEALNKAVPRYISTNGNPKLMNNVMSTILFKIPSLPEQHQIAQLLQTVDRLLDLHCRKYQQLKLYKKGLLQNLFPRCGEDEPKLRLTGFSGKWKKVKLRGYLQKFKLKNKNNMKYPAFSVNNKQGFVLQDRQFGKGNTYSRANKSTNYIVYPGMFAYNPSRLNVGSIGYQHEKGAVVISPLYVVFKLNNINNGFFSYWLKTEEFKHQLKQLSRVGVRTNFSIDDLGNVIIALPSLPEQQAIARLLASIDKRIALEKQKVQQLKLFKKFLLQNMFV